MDQRIKLDITDTTGVWDNHYQKHLFLDSCGAKHTYYFRIPQEWVKENSIQEENIEKLLDYLYFGKNYVYQRNRERNAHWIVLSLGINFFENNVVKGPWEDSPLCYMVTLENTIKPISPDEF